MPTCACWRYRSPPWMRRLDRDDVPDRDVVLLDERDPQPAAGRIEERARADDPAADDEQVPLLVGEPLEVRAATGEGRRRACAVAGPVGTVIGRRPQAPAPVRGERRIRHRTRPSRRSRTTIRSGVWNTMSWPSRGRSAVTPAATSTVRIDRDPATSSDLARPGWRTSSQR